VRARLAAGNLLDQLAIGHAHGPRHQVDGCRHRLAKLLPQLFHGDDALARHLLNGDRSAL
jgi:hypothetical protein